MKLESSWKRPLFWASFTELEGAIQTVRGEMIPMILTNYKKSVATKCCCNKDMTVTGVTNHFLIGFVSGNVDLVRSPWLRDHRL